MNLLRLLALSILLALTTLSATAKRSAIDSLAIYHESTALNSGKINQEMIYLHLDNTSYYRGDRIHFAGYLVTSGSLKPSDMSRTVYVELLNPAGEIIDHCILKTVEGRFHGSLLVNEQPFYSGYYEIRAYTRYMLSFGAETVFSRVLPVFKAPALEGNWAERDMQVTDGLRRPVKAEGRVLNSSDGSEVATFSSGHLGRGTFSFVPRSQKYRAEVTVDGKRYTYDLPRTAGDGISLAVNNLLPADSVRISVSRTPGSPIKSVGATLTCRNELCGRAILDLTETEETSFSVARAQMPTGIIQLTLFDTSGSPVADRPFFNNRTPPHTLLEPRSPPRLYRHRPPALLQQLHRHRHPRRHPRHHPLIPPLTLTAKG